MIELEVDERGAETPSSASRPSGVLTSAATGLVAAGIALSAGELVTALLDSPPSLVTAVGSEFIDRFAASLKDIAVALFGTNDKAALVTGIVVTSLLLGVVIGIVARGRTVVAAIGLGAFGLIGAWALASDPQGSTTTAVVAAGAALIAGVGTFAALTRLARPATPRTAPSSSSSLDRRSLIGGLGAFAVTAAVGAVFARWLRRDDSVDAAREATVLPSPDSTTPRTAPALDLPGLAPFVTPNDDFYRIDTALSTPQVSPASWRLRVSGMVEQPFELDYEELLALPSVERTVTIACVSNEVGGHLVGNAVWQGVPLARLFERARVQEGADQIVGRAVDGFTAGFPTSIALDGRTAVVAYAMNGEPLPADHGYPARLIVAGLYGYVSATKWLEEIELTTWDAFDGYWIRRGWSKEGPIKTASRIDVPRPGATIPAGAQPIAGVAWAPGRGIARVEVQVDDGPWLDCELTRVPSDESWVHWHTTWDAVPGRHRVRVRATDGDGNTQTERPSPPAPDGATGWHSRDVRVT